MEDNKSTEEYIDLIEVAKKIWSRKLLFIKVWIVVFILACIWIFPQPREYVSSTVMVPELAGEGAGGNLADIASSFGIDLGNNTSTDAYYPDLYPDVISTNYFIVKLLYVKVKTTATDDEPSREMTYLDHLTKYDKKNMLTLPFRKCMKFIKETAGGEKAKPISKKIDPCHLSREESGLVERIKKNVSCDIDKKTSVIKITVWDQDAEIAAQIADTVSSRLQDFIIQYRTHKARIDLDHYVKLQREAYRDYKNISAKYSSYCDTHNGMILQSYISERDELENQMSIKLTAMNAMTNQIEAAKAKLQEKTPAFTTLSKADVPYRPEKPKRVLFVLAMLFLSTFGTIGWLFKQEITHQLKNIRN